MGASSVSIDHAILQQAAWWYATLLDADSDSDAHARWRHWVQDPQHAQAWAQMEAVGRQFAPLRGEHKRHAADAGLQAARRARHGRRRVLSGLASLAALGVLGSQAPWLRNQWQMRTADYRTATAEVRATALTDGSRIWLAPGSALDVDYGMALRALRLHAGELHVETAFDAGRGFVVEAAGARLRALGTRFNVRLREQVLQLSVFEGAVEVSTARDVRVVDAGQGLRLDAKGAGQAHALGGNDDSWIRGVLMADQMPLGELVAELARYRHGHLGTAPEIAQLPVVGVFPLRDPDAALSMLEQSLPVRVQRPLPWWTTLEARR